MIKLNKKRIDDFLSFRRWNQSELARALGFSESYITLLLNGEREPSSEVMERFVHTTGLSFDELFFCVNSYQNVNKKKRSIQKCKHKARFDK